MNPFNFLVFLARKFKKVWQPWLQLMLLVQDMDYVSPSPHKIYVDGWCDHDRILSLLNPYNQMILGIRTQGERLLEARLMILNGLPSSENDRSPTRVPAFRSSERFSTIPELRNWVTQFLKIHTSRDHQDMFTKECLQVYFQYLVK